MAVAYGETIGPVLKRPLRYDRRSIWSFSHYSFGIKQKKKKKHPQHTQQRTTTSKTRLLPVRGNGTNKNKIEQQPEHTNVKGSSSDCVHGSCKDEGKILTAMSLFRVFGPCGIKQCASVLYHNWTDHFLLYDMHKTTFKSTEEIRHIFQKI